MPISHEFDYEKPGTLSEAVRALARYDGQAAVLAGGTDLVGWLKEDFVRPRAVIDIKGLDELKTIELADDALRIGALTTFNQLIDSALVKERFPLIWESAIVVACKSVRNRATLAGNICAAVPCCDAAPPLLDHGATVLVEGPSGERRIPIEQWFRGPKQTTRRPDEIVKRVDVPVAGARQGACYVKLGRYRGEDLAQVSVAVLALPDAVRVAFGAVAPTPVRAMKIEAVLAGAAASDTVIEKAVKLVESEIAPITDVRSTREYRLHMAKVMLKRGLAAAWERLAGRGPEYGTRLI